MSDSGIVLLFLMVQSTDSLPTDFYRCMEEIASLYNEFGNRWSKRESVECNALKEWKLSIFNKVDERIKLYSY